jgi:hypothetical protein
MNSQQQLLQKVRAMGLKVGDCIQADVGFQQVRIIDTDGVLTVEPAWNRQTIYRAEQIGEAEPAIA